MIKKNGRLCEMTTMRVGGKPSSFFYPTSYQELANFIYHSPHYYLLGGGSNVLAPDEGVAATVIKLDRLPKILKVVKETEQEVWIQASASISKFSFLSFCKDLGFSGMEFCAGIPGNIGGGLAMNAGTPLGDFGTMTEEILILFPQGKLEKLPKEKVGFGYRSVHVPTGAVFLEGVFKLKKNTKENVSKTIQSILKHRQETQPVSHSNCGCIFKNPTPVSAGQLIDQAGLKGTRMGHAQISNLHANFIINKGGARFDDIISLISLAKKTVQEKCGVTLEEEVKIWS
ncbi:MAG: UDP-N-acetylmuramate dehydrogenase [Deltaproteobacteria bacterium]|nr:UDP-N-acetylmuramate dehydrogenase [Deltaproteobacteria bacterium]